MPHISKAYEATVSVAEHAQLMATHYPVGYHPETIDTWFLPYKLRYSGMYIIGVQGMGKSGLLENLIAHDIQQERAVIVVDPHADLVDHVVAQMEPHHLRRTYLLDMTDIDYPFGLNVFSVPNAGSATAFDQAIDRVMHWFDVIWPDVLNQQYFPRFLRASAVTLYSNHGSTLADMLRLIVDEPYRAKMLKAVNDPSVREFWLGYDRLPGPEKRQAVGSLVTRLENLTMGRSTVRNIIGQRETSIDFRKSIENKEIILIKLPLKTLAQDAKLIGTLIVAQLHAAIFSFADLPEDQRPGVSVYVDEFQHFATPDFAEMFSEGRKFGVRICLAHQYRGQLPTFLQHPTLTAATKVCFRTTPDDANDMAHFYLHGEPTLKAEDIEPRPVEHLLKYGSENPAVQTFVNTYLRPLQSQKTSGRVEIKRPGTRWEHVGYWLVNAKPPEEKPKVADPTPYLNHLLYEVMKTGAWGCPILPQIVYGFANCGRGFYKEFMYTAFHGMNKQALLTSEISFPRVLVVEGAHGLRWTRPPETNKEQLYHFLFHLRATMKHLAEYPLGKRTTASASDVALMLTQLPKRAAFVRSGDEQGVIYTEKTLPLCSPMEAERRLNLIRQQTRLKYCTPKESLNAESPPVKESVFSRWEEVE